MAAPVRDHPMCVSVIICTHNPRLPLLKWAIDSIKTQTLDPAHFEVIVVDNNSSPPLDEAALDPGGLDFRVIVQKRPGLTYARVAGIAAARADLLVFVDDDNHLDARYVANAISIADAEPQIGVFGGISEAALDRRLPRWKERLIEHLGVRNYGPAPITSFEDRWGKWDPIGAGMVARRDVARRFAAFVAEHDDAGGLGRRGTSLMSGEDTLLARCGNRLGYACSYQPSLSLKHDMSGGRLRLRTLTRTLEGHGRSYVRLQRLLGRPVAPIRGLSALTHLGPRLLYRLARRGRAGYVIWHWDLGYVRESRVHG